MKKKLYLLLVLMVLLGCRSKKSSRTDHREEQQIERREEKDSLSQVESHHQVATFDLQHSQSYELSLENDKDSIEVQRERRIVKRHDGEVSHIEVLKIKGGKATLRVKQEQAQQARQVVHREQRRSEGYFSQKKKEVLTSHTMERETLRQRWGLAWWVEGLLLVVVLWLGYRIVRRWIG